LSEAEVALDEQLHRLTIEELLVALLELHFLLRAW